MNKKKQLILQLLANVIPLIGFWFFNWNMFAIIYMYWAEGFITAFYSSSKIAIASGPEKDIEHSFSFFRRLYSSIKFFIFRALVLLFYWIFIYVFVAYPDGGLNKDLAMQNYNVMWLHDSIFNSALLAYFLSQFILFIGDFIATDDYINKPSSEYKVLFDNRTIVLHVVIVLGTFSYQFFQKYETVSNKLPGLSYVLILVILKSLTDIFRYRYLRNIEFKND